DLTRLVEHVRVDIHHAPRRVAAPDPPGDPADQLLRPTQVDRDVEDPCAPRQRSDLGLSPEARLIDCNMRGCRHCPPQPSRLVRAPTLETLARPYSSRAMSVVAIDARDAFIEPLRGWGRYAKELIGHLPPDLETRVFEQGNIGPEAWFEQVTLPRALRREGAALVHATNCFLPLRRPCPGVVTI